MLKARSNFSSYNVHPSTVHRGLMKEVTVCFQLGNVASLRRSTL
jgi:hypothetical protein